MSIYQAYYIITTTTFMFKLMLLYICSDFDSILKSLNQMMVKWWFLLFVLFGLCEDIITIITISFYCCKFSNSYRNIDIENCKTFEIWLLVYWIIYDWKIKFQFIRLKNIIVHWQFINIIIIIIKNAAKREHRETNLLLYTRQPDTKTFKQVLTLKQGAKTKR